MSEVKKVGSPEVTPEVKQEEKPVETPVVDPREPQFEETPEVPENTKPEKETVPEESKSEDAKVVDEVPDQYRDKTPQELIEMHQNLEKVMGKQGQRVGEYKRILEPYANFDEQGNIISWKQKEKPEEKTQEDWDKIEEESGVTRKAYEMIENRIEKKFEDKLQASIQPITTRFHQTDLDTGLRSIEDDGVKYPNAKEWGNDIRAELEKEDIKYRHLPWMIEEKYFIIAGRKSVEAQAKVKTVSVPKENIKKPYAETPTPVRTETPEEYDPIAQARADKDERHTLRGLGA